MRASRKGKFRKIVQREFAKQAEEYSRSQEMRRKGGLEFLPRLAGVRPSHRVLDLACGPGFIALEFSKYGRHVVGVDLTEEMTRKARALARREKVKNVSFCRADATCLPFPAGSFDRVVTRASFHHFPEPKKVLREMVRVLRKRGRILISDNTAKDNRSQWRLHNLIEKLRDPSHVEMLPPRKWRSLFQAFGLKVVRQRRLAQARKAEDWMRLSQTPSQVREQIREHLLASIPGDRTGQNVRLVDGEIVFDLNYRIFVLAKP